MRVGEELSDGFQRWKQIKRVNSTRPDRPWGFPNDGAIQRTSMAGSPLGALGSVWRSIWVP